MVRKRGRDVNEWKSTRAAVGELEALGEGAATDVGVGRSARQEVQPKHESWREEKKRAFWS
jgi:uncharacterized protein YjiS (DUF1127 family)